MSRFSYVNGRFLPHAQASISIDDRGFLFGDAIYEVWSVRHGHLLDAEGHFERLKRSLGELRIPMPIGVPALRLVIGELLRRNRVDEGLVYLEISRGAARRDHVFPPAGTRPTEFW